VKQTFIIETSKDLKQFKRDFVNLVDVVRRADGKYVLYVDTVQRNSPANSLFVSQADFDRVVSPTMYGKNPAFSQHVAGGRFLPDRLSAAYGALARENARKAIEQHGARKMLNRQEYIAYYYGDFTFYPSMGAPLNQSMNEKL
jgi:hypothetical protein